MKTFIHLILLCLLICSSGCISTKTVEKARGSSQTKDDETQVLFKDLEYKTEAANKFSIGNLIGAPVAINYVALHPSRAGQLTEKQQLRLAEGLANLSVAIQTATDQTPLPVTPPIAP